MANTLTSLQSVWTIAKNRLTTYPGYALLLAVMVTIPLPYAFNSAALISLALYSVISFRKNKFSLRLPLLLPVFLFMLMAASLIWSIHPAKTLSALSTELPLVILPFCFMVVRPEDKHIRKKVLVTFAYAMTLFAVYLLIRAAITYAQTKDTSLFFYHGLAGFENNAIYVSAYIFIAFFILISAGRVTFSRLAALMVLGVTLILLSSKTIIGVTITLMVIYILFFAGLSNKFKAGITAGVCFIIVLTMVLSASIRNRFMIEVTTAFSDNTRNTRAGTRDAGIYNVSLNEAWNKEKFNASNFFPGGALRLYQTRIFTEMLAEDNIFFTGYGMKASQSKIEEKAVEHNLHPGYGSYNFHNQYVQVFADLGIAGLLLLLAMLGIILKIALKTKDFIHIAFAVLMISLFLTESFLWRQRGVVFFTVFYCFFGSHLTPVATKQ